LLLYYITDRAQFPGTEPQRRERVLRKISEAALAGVDYIQLRERDLTGRALESLAEQAAQLIRDSRSSSHLLINSRTDIALAAKAHGVHLTSNDISSLDVKKTWRETQPSEPIIAVSCHSEADVIAAESASDRSSVEFVVFGPIFEKRGSRGMPAGLSELRRVCRHRIPVLALGGVTEENAHLCIEAGAKGIAGIRLFQENDVARVVTKLRGLK
jgi:thiamine-phosphate pyrophosphorylase